MQLKLKYRILSLVILFTSFLWRGAGGEVFAQQCTVIYVTPNGASSGTAGTKTAPASLTYALSLATATDNKIYMASGTYNISNAITMKANLTIEGGYNASTWKKSNATATTIYRDNSNVQSNPNRLVAVYCTNISNFRFQDLTIRTANGFGNGTSVYGIHLSGCSDYQIVRCKVIAGNAGDGTIGTNGNSGIAGASGLPGDDGSNDDAAPRSGGLGGSGSFTGSLAGGTGGDGGERGTADCALCGDPNHAKNGYPGTSGQTSGSGGGIGGMGGQKIVTCIYPTTPPRTSLNDGAPGTDGANGLQGTNGTNGIAAFTGGFYMPGNGTSGAIGSNGHGGGGGGGGGSIGGIPYDCLFGLPPNKNGTGAGGGGGGEGGQGGTGGTGGTGGGGSFGIYIHNNGANGIIKDTKITSGNAGFGGVGGNGGAGGAGGTGGTRGGGGNGYVGAGGNGGNGGNGGDGGKGGAGSDGVTYTLYEDGGTLVSEQNVYSLQQPFVFVQYSGCTDAPVTFSTNATGTVVWFFGAGASPASGSGITATTKYTTQGRKTFTMVNNGIAYTYTDFIEIYSTGAGIIPEVNSSDNNVCAGTAGTYTSSVAADEYLWYFIRGNEVDTIEGSAFQNATYTFDSAGTYQVILRIVDNCCGESFPDTMLVEVEGIVKPYIEIQSESPSNIACSGASFTFSAGATNAGTSPTYQWLVNGVPSGTFPVFITNALADGDSVSCVIISSLGCSTGQEDTSGTIGVTVIDPPVITCTAEAFVSGEPTTLVATVNSGGVAPFEYAWTFGDGAAGAGDTVSHIYQEAGAYDYQVNVTDSNGCEGSCSGGLIITSTLSAGFETSISGGCPILHVDFTNTSIFAITYLWDFGDGTTSVDENPSHDYINPGLYTVTLMAFGATGTDTSIVTGQVYVYPPPVSNFQAYVSQGGDTAYFADNSLNATGWLWDFGDGNSSTIQNPTHTYAANGTYSISLIVTNSYGCADTTYKPTFVNIGVGITEFSFASSDVHVFPNPFSGELNINIASLKEGVLTLTLMNIEGARVVSVKRDISKGDQQMKITELADKLAPGMYLMELECDGQRHYTKLIYQK
ncbi:MAG: PKD domain-containing protein [Bacteroidia bacterium]